MGTATSRRNVSSGPRRRGFRYSKIDLRVPAEKAVGGDHQRAGCRRLERRRRAGAVRSVVPYDGQRRRETGDLALPVADHRGRAHEERPPPVLGTRRAPVEQEGEELDGLAEPHVVGEAGAEAEVGHLDEPAEAALLVGAERAVEVQRHRGAARAGALAQPGDDAGEVPLRHDVDGESRLRPPRRRAEGRGQRLVRRERAAPSCEEPPGLCELRGIDRHPLAAEAHERCLERGEREEVARRECLARERRLPTEGRHRVERQATRTGHRAGRARRPGADAHAEPQAPLPGPRQLRGQNDAHARLGERGSGAGEERPRLARVEEHALRPRGAQAARDGGKEPRAHGEGAEQVLLGRVEGTTQATQGLPAPTEDLAGRDEQARVVGGLEEEAERESVGRVPAPRLGALRVGQIQSEAGARRTRLGAERRAGPGVEVGEEGPLPKAIGREGGVRPGERGGEASLPGDVRVLPPARPGRRARSRSGADERVGRRVEEGPEERLGCPHLRLLVRCLQAPPLAPAVHRHGVRGQGKHLRQRHHPLRVLGQGERDGEARLGAAVRRHDARDQALAAHQVECQLGGQAPAGHRRRRAVRLGGGHRREEGQRVEEWHRDARELARRVRFVHEAGLLRRAASGERRRDRARSPHEEARRRAVGKKHEMARALGPPHPWPGSRPLHPPHRSRHGAGILHERRARAHGDGRWGHRSRSRRGTRWLRLAGRSSPQWTHGKQRLRLQRLLLAEGRQWV